MNSFRKNSNISRCSKGVQLSSLSKECISSEQATANISHIVLVDNMTGLYENIYIAWEIVMFIS